MTRARPDTDAILSVEDLHTAFFTDKETIRAADGVSFDIGYGETVGIVGESGSGKSVTARSIMGLVESPGKITDGHIKYRGVDTVRQFANRYSRSTADLTEGDTVDDGDFVAVEERDADGAVTAGYVDVARMPENARQRLRGSAISMVFQDPLTSLNPVYTVGNQIKEALRLHQDLRGREATREAIELLEAVGIPDAPRRVDEYPHEFSGGMRQRAVIATALACDPELLICDEPTTALDVTIQAQILELLKELQEERDLSIMFITHDMGVVAEICDRVNVMYAGELVERASAVELFGNPKHPYTQGLLDSIPSRNTGGDRLSIIEGDVETPNEPATYCRFAPRCPKAFDECDHVHPVLVDVNEANEDHEAACLLYPEDETRERAVERHRSQATGAEVER
ncbi:ABC transporter ATP-binding protein [Salarchaeum sp. JOR-1]|uniref:ABC transporter ATP-binding protein n=1 Tax=Salarchaeum sp. JOR-1 TaxID=2599399 RepID=UPI00119868F3|nr:ABC transporter ATP-binding protein [Salarchaeum sp. JOR-1]QDX40222.1 ABC transporter ATP-binding protein [Salarchaeum sp. JOR-1]